jgi:hypothetical protein
MISDASHVKRKEVDESSHFIAGNQEARKIAELLISGRVML